MLYKIAPKGDFFELTLTVESEHEATVLHDDLACFIATSSEFIGDVYMASIGNKEEKEGVVPLAPRKEPPIGWKIYC